MSIVYFLKYFIYLFIYSLCSFVPANIKLELIDYFKRRLLLLSYLHFSATNLENTLFVSSLCLGFKTSPCAKLNQFDLHKNDPVVRRNTFSYDWSKGNSEMTNWPTFYV